MAHGSDPALCASQTPHGQCLACYCISDTETRYKLQWPAVCLQAYKQDSRMHHLPIVFWVTTAGTGLLGVVAFVTARGVLLALHVTLSISLAAAVAAHNVLSFLLLRDKCLLSQTSFSGCQACPCAAQSLCTRALMAAQPGCSPCQAWPLDTCAAITGTNSLMAFMVRLGTLSTLITRCLPCCSNTVGAWQPDQQDRRQAC
ncbi:hypothetical protein V8C86DRAFT_2679688 [Haematococcus lacustris]